MDKGAWNKGVTVAGMLGWCVEDVDICMRVFERVLALSLVVADDATDC